MLLRTDLAESLALAGRSLREQEVAAINLAATLARLSAETQKILLEIESQPHLESSTPCPLIAQPSDLLPGTVAVTAVSDDTAWKPPKSSAMPALNTNVRPSSTFPNPKEWSTELLQARADTVAKKNSQSSVFPDPKEFRDRVRLNLIEEEPEDFYKESGWPQHIVRHNLFEVASFVLVLFSSIWIAIDMDFNSSLMLHEAKPIFQVVAHVICILFVLELLLRCMAFKHMMHAFKDCWCVFDMVLVSALVCEVWVFGTVAATSGLSIAGSGLKVVIVFRVLRLCRAFRLARVLQHLPELMFIVRGLGMAFRAILVVLLFLTGIIYMGAIIFRGMLEGSAFGAEWFPSVLGAMGTLMLDCTLSGARGTSLIREAYKESVVYAGLLLCFVLLANVTMMSVITGVLVQTVKTVAGAEKEEKSVKDLISTMDALWHSAMKHNEGVSGTIDEVDLRNMMSIKETALIMRQMDVDVEGMETVSGFIFEQHGGRLSRKDFLKMVLDLRGSQKATVKDHIETRKFVHADLKRAHGDLRVASFDHSIGIQTTVSDEV